MRVKVPLNAHESDSRDLVEDGPTPSKRADLQRARLWFWQDASGRCSSLPRQMADLMGWEPWLDAIGALTLTQNLPTVCGFSFSLVVFERSARSGRSPAMRAVDQVRIRS